MRLLSSIQRGHNIVIAKRRPGDLFFELAKIAKIRKKIARAYIAGYSLYFNFTDLSCFSGIEFVEINDCIKPEGTINVYDINFGPLRRRGLLGTPCDFETLLHALSKKYECKKMAQKDRELKIFISLESEKKIWHGQVDLIDSVIKGLDGRRVTIVNNGMAQPIGLMETPWKEEQRKYEEIILERFLNYDGVSIVNLFGKSLEEKFHVISSSHLAITPLGVPSIMAACVNVPSICAGNHWYHRFYQYHRVLTNRTNILKIPLKHTVDLPMEEAFRDKGYNNNAQLASFKVTEDFDLHLEFARRILIEEQNA